MGASSWGAHRHAGSIVAFRPRHFFRSDGPMPEDISFALTDLDLSDARRFAPGTRHGLLVVRLPDTEQWRVGDYLARAIHNHGGRLPKQVQKTRSHGSGP